MQSKEADVFGFFLSTYKYYFILFFSSQANSGQSSLLGEPPKEVRLPSNPYLNLASVMPGVVLQGD